MTTQPNPTRKDPTKMKLELHLNAVRMKWRDAQQMAEQRGDGWRLPTRAEVLEHAAAINEDLAEKFLAYVWTSDEGTSTWGGAITTSGRTVSTKLDGQPTGLYAWRVCVNTRRESSDNKSRTSYVVLVRNVGGQA